MTAQPTSTPADDAPYWDAALETQTPPDWDAMKLELLKPHLQHAYRGSPYYRASFDAAACIPAWSAASMTCAGSRSSTSARCATGSSPSRRSATWLRSRSAECC